MGVPPQPPWPPANFIVAGQMGEGLTTQGDRNPFHPGEIAEADLTGLIRQREHHLRRRAMQRLPMLHPPLQPKNPVINETHKQQLSVDQRRRNEVEGVFGSGKRKYSLRLIMARLAKGAETLISMTLLVMCAEKIRRLLRLFFIFISAWLYAWQRPASSRMVLMHIWLLVTSEQLLTAQPY